MQSESDDTELEGRVIAKEQPSQGEKVQVSLGFRVVKRSSATSGKGGSSGPSKPRASPTKGVHTPPRDGVVHPSLNRVPHPAISQGRDSGQMESECHVSGVAQISEIPELVRTIPAS